MTLFKDGDFKDNVRPRETTGDGNCLFNAVSIAICETKILETELKLRTAGFLHLCPEMQAMTKMADLVNLTILAIFMQITSLEMGLTCWRI